MAAVEDKKLAWDIERWNLEQVQRREDRNVEHEQKKELQTLMLKQTIAQSTFPAALAHGMTMESLSEFIDGLMSK